MEGPGSGLLGVSGLDDKGQHRATRTRLLGHGQSMLGMAGQTGVEHAFNGGVAF